MAGRGRRFVEAGYSTPKPFIPIDGRPMIEHVLDNLALPGARFIAIAREEHLVAESAAVDQLKARYSVEFVTVDQVTNGAACTALFAHRLLDGDSPVLLANSDQIVESNLTAFTRDAEERELDGSILTFAATDPKWSYARLGAGNLVVEVREKVPISPHATVGLYYFRCGSEFVRSAIDMIIRNDRVNGEFYVCPVYNYLIAAGGRVGIYEIESQAMFGTGTPADLMRYVEHLGV
jgi:dTDP-glucose pyrophosphorylase